MDTKHCAKCNNGEGANQPVSSFHKNQKYCKACNSRQVSEWQKDNPERANAKARRYKTSEHGKARVRAYNTEWVKQDKAKNPEKWKQRQFRTDLAKYGLTPEKHQEFLEKQNGVCAICKQPNQTKRRLAIDHDHKTGHVRGLLCALCNAALERIENIETWAAKVHEYLHPGK